MSPEWEHCTTKGILLSSSAIELILAPIICEVAELTNEQNCVDDFVPDVQVDGVGVRSGWIRPSSRLSQSAFSRAGGTGQCHKNYVARTAAFPLARTNALKTGKRQIQS